MPRAVRDKFHLLVHSSAHLWPLKQQNGASLSKIEKDLIAAAGYIVREWRSYGSRSNPENVKTENASRKG